MVQRKEATSANKNNYDEFDENDKEEMATVKIVMKGAEDKSAIRRSGEMQRRKQEKKLGNCCRLHAEEVEEEFSGGNASETRLESFGKFSGLFLKIIGKSTEMVSRKT